MDRPDWEEALEAATVELFDELGWGTINAYHEQCPDGMLGRDNESEVVLLSRLQSALRQLNPDLPAQAIDLAVEELARDRSALSLPNANREVHRLLRQGVRVEFRGRGGGNRPRRRLVRPDSK
jgi:type I restriction enzyme R subunit